MDHISVFRSWLSTVSLLRRIRRLKPMYPPFSFINNSKNHVFVKILFSSNQLRFYIYIQPFSLSFYRSTVSLKLMDLKTCSG